MQPKIFGEVPLDFDFPCFDMMADEIKIIDAPKKVEDEVKEDSVEGATNSTADSEETIGGFKVEDILNVVSKTADQGIKIISELFGVGGDEATEATPAESKSEPETPKNDTNSR